MNTNGSALPVAFELASEKTLTRAGVARTLVLFLVVVVIANVGLGIAATLVLLLTRAITHHQGLPLLYKEALYVALTTVAFLLALLFTVRHRLSRPRWLSLMRHVRPQPRRVLNCAGLWFVAHLVSFAVFAGISIAMDPSWAKSLTADFARPPGKAALLAWLLFILIFPFQSAVEEIVFRGSANSPLAASEPGQ